MEKVLRVVRKARLLRNEKGRTLKDVAAAVNIGESTLSNFEIGRADLAPETLNRLAKYFAVPPAELLEEIQGSRRKALPQDEQPGAELKNATVNYQRATRLLVEGLSDGEIVTKLAASLQNQNRPWPDRIGAARALLLELEARHAGE